MKLTMQIGNAVRTAQIFGVSLLSLGLIHLVQTAPTVAQVCNVFGCSQPGAGACNVFGCPNPGAGECTTFGCPASPPSSSPPSSAPSGNFSGNSSRPSNPSSNGPRAARSFQVINNTGLEFYYLYASPANQASWSDDLLGTNTLPNGQVWNMTLSRGCLYDFWAELYSGQTLFWEDINVCDRNQITLNY